MKISDISEGGWASELTQQTKITPQVVRQAVRATEDFVDSFNNWLQQQGQPLVKKGHPVGSSFYWKRDLANDPDREYGDIDYLLYIPMLKGSSNAQNSKIYAELVQEFVAKNPDIQTTNGINLILKIKNDYVQIDLVHGYFELKDWLQALKPEYQVKGIISSSLYSSIAKVLNLSIGSYGVQAKLKNNQPVNFSQRKATELVTISTNPTKWARDILIFYAKLAGVGNASIPPGQMGIDPNEIKVNDIAGAAKWLAVALEENNLLGAGALSQFQTAKDILNEINSVFADKMQAQINNPKFNKAKTPKAIAKVKETQQKLKDAIDWIRSALTL